MMAVTPLLVVAAAHAVCALLMTGVILFVQVVDYPLMRLVPAEAGIDYAKTHQRLTTIVVAPIMLLELALAVALLVTGPGGPAGVMIAGASVLLAVAWLSTFFVQVPLHRRLVSDPDAPTVRRLVATNWVRTVAWAARAGLSVLIVFELGVP